MNAQDVPSASATGDDQGIAEQLITIGKLGAPYGVRGWVKVHSYTDPRESILAYPVWLVQAPTSRSHATVEYRVTSARVHGKAFVAQLEGVEDRDHAARMTGMQVVTRRDNLPKLEEGHYWLDLIGKRVLTMAGIELGKVARLMETGANDVLVVQGDRERLIPWIVDDVILRVETNVIVVDWDADF